jgi:dCMP deaminase
MRAVLDSANKGVSLKGSTCYVTLMSCNECAKNMAHLGIKEVVYMEDRNDPLFVASHKTFECTGVKQRQIKLA